MRRRVPLIAWLTVVWIGLWGDLSWANVAGGAAAGSTVVMLFDPPQELGLGIRPFHLVRFIARFARNLVKASLEVAGIVIRPKPNIRKAVIAVPIAATTRGVTLVIAAAISLTPGTLVIETTQHPDRTVLFIHVLDLRDRTKTVAEVARLERLATAAFAPNTAPPRLEHRREAS